jgi:hypothetical protein
MTQDASGAEHQIAKAEHVGRTCPYCRFPLKEGGEIALCRHCRAAHHADCWTDNGGCAVLGCAGAPSAREAEQTARMSPASVPSHTETPRLQPDVPAQVVTRRVVAPTGYVPAPPPAAGGTTGTTKGIVAALIALAVAIGGVAVALALKKSGNTDTIAQVAEHAPGHVDDRRHGAAGDCDSPCQHQLPQQRIYDN